MEIKKKRNLWTEPHQDVSLEQQPGFNGDADACVAVSLDIAVVENWVKTIKWSLWWNDELLLMIAVIHVLYSWSVDWLHGLVDLQKRTAACNVVEAESKACKNCWPKISQRSFLTVSCLLWTQSWGCRAWWHGAGREACCWSWCGPTAGRWSSSRTCVGKRRVRTGLDWFLCWYWKTELLVTAWHD